MSKGVVLFAFNNKAINYVEQAEFCAKKIIRHLQLPVTIVTSDKVTNKDLFDKINEIKTKTVTITPKINIDVVKSPSNKSLI